MVSRLLRIRILFIRSLTDVNRLVILLKPSRMEFIVDLWWTRFSRVFSANSNCSSNNCSALVKWPLSFSSASLTTLSSLISSSSWSKFNIVLRLGLWMAVLSFLAKFSYDDILIILALSERANIIKINNLLFVICQSIQYLSLINQSPSLANEFNI